MAMNMIKRKKDKSIVAKLSPNQVKAPSFNTNWSNSQFIGTVIPKTNTTARPKPIAVDTFFETAKKEHMPKK